MKSLKDHIQEKKMDPVGKADADIDNDGDVDSSDKYLHNRRKAIKKAMKKEACWDGYKQVGMKKKGNKKVPNCVPEETVDEAMSPESQKAHRSMFKAGAKKQGDAQAQAEREKRLKAKGWVRNNRGGFSKEEFEQVDEVDRGFGSRMKAADAAANSYSKEKRKPENDTIRAIRAKHAAKKVKEEMQHHHVLVHNPKNPKDHVVVKTKALNKSDAMKKVKSQYDNNKYKFAHHVEETQTEAIYHDTGWRKVSGPRKDKYGNTIKKKNVAKHLAKKGMAKASAFANKKEEVDLDEDVTTALKKKAAKSGISVSTLRKVYNRGVAAWRTGHRPGTTPSQWGMARVNSYITKGKGTYHGADKDLREDIERHADVKMVKTKTPDGRTMWKKVRKETEVSKHNEGVDYHHIDDIEIAIGEFVGVEKLQEALNRLQQMKYAKAAKELKAYAKKRGGIDKKDFMMAAQLMDDGEAMELSKFVRKMDTDPRDYVYTVMAKHGLMKKR